MPRRTAVLLGGPPGVGKSSILKLLQEAIPNSATLDADQVSKVDIGTDVLENRSVAIGNVVTVMRGYFESGCEFGILSWVFARAELYAPVVMGLQTYVDSVLQIYLVADEYRLEERLRKRGHLDRLDYSISRLRLIEALPFLKLDTSNMRQSEVAERVKDLIHENVKH